MDSAAIRAVIKGKKLDKKPVYDKPNGKVIDWTLSFQNPSESQGLTFKYLGAGSNKMVAQVYKTSALPWVLCWQSNERYQGAYRDFKDEVETLQRLGKPDGTLRGCRVPLPFPVPGEPVNELFQFNVDNWESGDVADVWAFVIEFLDMANRYIEYKKKEGDLAGFLEKKCFAPNRAEAKKHVKSTRDTFDAIVRKWKQKTWGDFQVLYDKQTGELVVFDPLSDSTPTAEADVTKALAQWEKDIAALEKP